MSIPIREYFKVKEESYLFFVLAFVSGAVCIFKRSFIHSNVMLFPAGCHVLLSAIKIAPWDLYLFNPVRVLL